MTTRDKRPNDGRAPERSDGHAVDPSTLDPEQWVVLDHPNSIQPVVRKVIQAESYGWFRDGYRIVAVLHRADECPQRQHNAPCVGGSVCGAPEHCPPAEQWRQVTPEEVREGWLVRLTKPVDEAIEGRVRGGKGYAPSVVVSDIHYEIAWRVRHGWTLWTTEPADPTAERRRLIEAATGRCAETVEADLVEYGLAIVEVAK